MASLWNCLLGIILLNAVSDAPGPLRLVAGASLVLLAAATCYRSRSRQASICWLVPEMLLLGLALWALRDPRLGAVLVLQGLFFRPVMSGWEAGWSTLGYTGTLLAFLVGADATTRGMSIAELVTQVVACLAFGAVKCVLSLSAAVSQRAMVREQILARASAGLVAAGSASEVHAAALSAVQQVLVATGLTRTSLALIEGDSFEVVASVGLESEQVRGKRQLLNALPERFRTYGREARTINVDAEAGLEFQSVLDVSLHPGTLSLTPLSIRGKFVGLLITETPAPLADEYTAGLTAVCGEVALALESTRLTENLKRQASEDPLTHLANRAAFVERLNETLERARGTGSSTGVMFIDLDNFKNVNDSLGHAAGDVLLIEVAGRLQSCAGSADMVARLGGDEFTILLADASAAAELDAIADRIATTLRNPIVIGERLVAVSASIGIALQDDSRMEGAGDLLRAADLALYAAKSRGKSQMVAFEPSMAADAMRRMELQANLRTAIERNELVLHYQPLIALDTGKVAEVEALVRWQHPVRGQVSPAEFIPLAEESGVIVPLGRWVLNEACRQMRAWRHRDTSGSLIMAVNLSGRQLHDPDLVSDVHHALQSNGIRARQLKLEITESIALSETPEIQRALEELKTLGVQLAIDDFGSGNSALRYLQHFAIDTLKIDKSFVDGLGRDERSTALLRGMVAFAKHMGLSVTGEGVETRDQSEWLRALGCDHAQGFLFARPGPPEALADLLGSGGEPAIELAA